MGDSDESLLKFIRHYQASLDKYTDKGKDDKLFHYIDRLYKLPIKVHHLEQTGVGRTVNGLRKLGGKVGDAAKHLVNKWKTMVVGEQDSDEQEDDDDDEDDNDDDGGGENNDDDGYSEEHVESANSQSSDDDSDRVAKKSHHHTRSPSRHSSHSRSDSRNEDKHRKSKHRNSSHSENNEHQKHKKEKHKHHKNGESKSHKRKHSSEDEDSENSEEEVSKHRKRERKDSSDDELKERNKHRNSDKHKSRKTTKYDSSDDDEDNDDNIQHVRSKYKKKEKSSREHASPSNRKHKSKKRDESEEPEKKSKHSKDKSKADRKEESGRHEHKKTKDLDKKESKSKESNKIKASSSSKNESKSKTTPKPKASTGVVYGIDSGSGASFAEALGMCEPSSSKSSSKKKSIVPEKPQKEKLPKTIEFDKAEDHIPKLLKEVASEPLDINLSSLLPPITPNYRPLGLSLSEPQPKKFQNEYEALSTIISSKNQRTKVYSGNKMAYGKVPTLFELCIRVLQDNIDALEYTGGVPYSILKPILDKATPNQLFSMEHHNPYLIDDTDELWQMHCQKDFRNKKREELESWREMYMRCLDEREAKLKALTANIKQAQDKSLPVRTTKLAYVNDVAKPPRNIARKQAKNGMGFDKRPAMTPSARLSTIATSGEAGKVSVPNPGARAVERSSHAAVKPKTAPLMAKSLSLLKNRFRR